MTEPKRWIACDPTAKGYGFPADVEVVAAADFDRLRDERDRLREEVNDLRDRLRVRAAEMLPEVARFTLDEIEALAADRDKPEANDA